MQWFLTWGLFLNINIIFFITHKVNNIKLFCLIFSILFTLLFFTKIFKNKNNFKIVIVLILTISIISHTIIKKNNHFIQPFFSHQTLKVYKKQKNNYLVTNHQKEKLILTKNYFENGISKKLFLDIDDQITGFFKTKKNYWQKNHASFLIKDKRIIWLDSKKKWKMTVNKNWRKKVIIYLQQKNNRQTNSWINFLLFQKISEEFYEKIKILNYLGITHLFVISGFHLLIIYKLINLKTKNKKINNFLKISSLIVCFLLTYLTNWKISTLKSFIFICCSFLSKKTFLKIKNKEEVLVLIAMFFLLYNPVLIFKKAFVLTMLASWFVLQFKKKHRFYYQKIYWLWIKNIVIFIVILPILINLNYQISFFAPLLSFLFGLLVIIFYPLFFTLIWFDFLKSFWNYFFIYLEKMIYFLNSNDHKIIFGSWKTIYFLIYYLLLILLFYELKKTQNNLKKKLMWFLFLMSFVFIYQLNWYQPYPKLHLINVKHGLAMLLQSPHARENILFDCGINRKKINNDDRILKFLHQEKVSHLDALFISHKHTDHYNNLKYLKKHLKIKKIITNQKQKPYYQIGRWKLQNFAWSYYQKMKNENDRSLVLKFDIKKWKILLPFDLEKKGQKILMTKKEFTKIDVFQMPHHGAITSISEEFLKKASPKYCLISDNKEHLQTITKLYKQSCNVLSTYDKNNITLIFKDKILINNK